MGAPWELLAQAVGKGLADKIKPNEKRLNDAWDLFQRYAPPDTQAAVQRGLDLVVLGFLPNDTPNADQVVTAYREIARTCHPDKTTDPAAHARFVAAGPARDRLLAPTSKG